jgi:hypothetical protein
MSRLLAPPIPAERTVSPYVGLQPFNENSARYFFARDAEREIIIANLIASRLTLLYGASGVGKSSILQAGVLHSLRSETPATSENIVLFFNQWRDDPLIGLSTLVQTAMGAAAKEDGKSFADLVFRATKLVPGAVLIILDQFEEYFLYHDDDSEDGFGAQLAALLNNESLRVNTLISMRDDSLARLDRFKGMISGLFDNRIRIEHLSRSAGRQAIIGPLRQFSTDYPEYAPVMIERQLAKEVLNACGSRNLMGGRPTVASACGDLHWRV